MGSRIAAPAALAALLCTAAAAHAASDASVRLSVPSQARPPSVRVLVQLRDCSTRPTVAITARWRRAAGRAALRVSGIERVLRRSPRPATRRTDRIIYHRVPRGTPIRATVITTWRKAVSGAASCKLDLPVLVGSGNGASAAARGVVRLRTPLPVSAPDEPPQRGTGRDHIWACGGARRGDFGCGQTVTVGTAQTARPDPGGGTKGGKTTGKCEDGEGNEGDNGEDCEDDDMDTEEILLAVIAALGALGIGAAALKKPEDPGAQPSSWDQIARDEYAKPAEPVGAHAGFITKVGAPTAALLTSLAAAVGGLSADAPEGHKIIAVAIVVAVSIGGVLYAFATDFRARAAVAVARLESLPRLAQIEAQRPAAAPAQPDESAAETRIVPLPELQATRAGSPTTVYAVESEGETVLRYLVRDSQGALVWVAAGDVADIGGT